MYTHMSSLNRHLLDAYYAWFAENALGRMNVLCYAEPVNCPDLAPFVVDGMVTLNLAPQAIRNFRYTVSGFSFNMTIRGKVVEVDVPFYALHSIALPVTDNIGTNGDFPPVEILMHQLQTNPEDVLLTAEIDGSEPDIAMAASNDEKLPPGAFAVFDPVRHNPDFAPDAFTPSVQVPPTAQAKEAPKPLLDFGHFGSSKIPLQVQPGSRYKGKPTLTVIQGGKKD